MAVPDRPKKPHFGRHIGIRFEAAEHGRARMTLDLQEHHLNPNGVVHGGVTYSLVDQGMGAALYSALPQTELASTLEIKINYLRAATTGRLLCEGWLVERADNLAILESDVRQGGQLIAKALGTYMIVPRKGPRYSVQASAAEAAARGPAAEAAAKDAEAGAADQPFTVEAGATDGTPADVAAQGSSVDPDAAGTSAAAAVGGAPAKEPQ